MTSVALQKKLFHIASRPRKYFGHPAVIHWKEFRSLEVDELFNSPQKPRVLELGSGWGEFAVQWALQHRDQEMVAMEIKPDRISTTLKQIDRWKLENLRILPVNFSWFLTELFPSNTFDTVFINFPDPWPKKRHWKHRLIQPDFPLTVHGLMRGHGLLHIATDHGPYSRRILKRFRNYPDHWRSNMPEPGYSLKRPEGIPETRFERIQSRLGYIPRFMQWERLDESFAR